MPLLQSCSVCGRFILFRGRRPGSRTFCSKACQDLAEHPGFCADCLTATTSESAGAFSASLVGTAFFGSWNRCRTCGSVEAFKVAMAFLPIYPLGRFRLIRFARGPGDAFVLSRRIPGRTLTWQIVASLGSMALIGVGVWAAFIAWVLSSNGR